MRSQGSRTRGRALTRSCCRCVCQRVVVAAAAMNGRPANCQLARLCVRLCGRARRVACASVSPSVSTPPGARAGTLAHAARLCGASMNYRRAHVFVNTAFVCSTASLDFSSRKQQQHVIYTCCHLITRIFALTQSILQLFRHNQQLAQHFSLTRPYGH